MEKKLLHKIKSIDMSSYPDIYKYGKPLEKALWVLLIFKCAIKYDGYLSAKEISEALLEIDISCKYIQISRALSRARDMVNRKNVQGEVIFKIMKKGEEHLKEIEGKDKLNILYIDGLKPWSDRKILVDEFIKELKDPISIVDKFFGSETLDILENFGNDKEIKFLTAKITDSSSKFKRDLKRFKNEYKNITVKLYSKHYELHDRYLLTNNTLCIFGHGFKDIGTKESFILILRDPAGREIRNTLKTKFDERWIKAQNFV